MTESAGASAALLGPADVRRLAERLGLRPTKQRGQNFVIDPNTVRRIVRVSGVESDDVVLEIGPGLGSLTLALLPAVARVVAVEVDPLLAAALPATAAERAPELAGRLTPCASAPVTCRALRRRRWSQTCRTTSRSRSCSTPSSRCPACGGLW
jgi:hypothetical protein